MNDYEHSLLNTPLKDIYLRNKLFEETAPFDEYHLVMAQTDLLAGIHEKRTVKSYFYRTAPFGCSYIINAGLAAFLAKIHAFSYSQIIEYAAAKGYRKEFTDYLKTRDKIKVNVYSLPENTPAFPNEPVIVLETSLFDSRILEGILLSEMNFGSLSATKWHRIRNAAENCYVMEFGRRRAQNSIKASLYSYMAGIDATSNCEANYLFGIPSSGTMGHEFVQSFSSEEEAFDTWLAINPDKPCLLIDTINTLESGVENAAKAFLKHRESLEKAGSWKKIGVRIDSGDLAYLAVQCWEKLRRSLGVDDITVVLSNDLDEEGIQSIFSQLNHAGESRLISRVSFGIGTKGATAWNSPALGGVCKISEIEDFHILKISNNNEKTTIPGSLRSSIVTDADNQYVTTLIYFADEDIHKHNRFLHINDDTKFIINSGGYNIGKTRQSLVYVSDGIAGRFEGEYGSQSLREIRNNSYEDLKTLDWSYKRIVKPHTAKVSLSERVFDVRRFMMTNNMMRMQKTFI